MAEDDWDKKKGNWRRWLPKVCGISGGIVGGALGGAAAGTAIPGLGTIIGAVIGGIGGGLAGAGAVNWKSDDEKD